MPLPEFNEIGLIKQIAGKIKNDSSVIRGIGDDAAVLRYAKDRYLLFACDMLIEGVDFTSSILPEAIGHKALACSLSDVAAMGGLAKYALISLGLPKRNPGKFIERFYRGVNRLAERFRTSIVGGDLSFSEKIVVDVSVLGEVKKNKLVLRSGAKAGDIIFVSGALGGSIYGRHLRFTPRLKEANYLVSNYRLNSMIDISDGLSLDLHRLCSASKAGAVVYEDLIPVSSDAKSADEALNMGEDFELLFTLSPKEANRLIKNKGIIFKAIGKVREKKYGINLITKEGKEKPLAPIGYQHF
jgi:thiamine-monophosphate kinase